MSRSCLLKAFVCLQFILAIGSTYGEYTVGPGDTLDVQVGDEPDLSGTFKVSDEGNIIYPLLGSLDIAGRPVSHVAKLIRERLDRDYIVSPQVAVYIADYGSKKVSIMGDVPNAGFFILRKDSNLLSLLDESGLRLSDGNATIIITRGNQGEDAAAPDTPLVVTLEKLVSPWYDDNPIGLENGDRIFVRSQGSGKVIVSGKVGTPGSVPITDGMTVMEAVNEAGGIAEFGSLKGVKVIREQDDEKNVITLDLTSVMNGEDVSEDIILQSGDIIVVPRRWF